MFSNAQPHHVSPKEKYFCPMSLFPDSSRLIC